MYVRDWPFEAEPREERRARALAAAVLRGASRALDALAARLALVEAPVVDEPVLEDEDEDAVAATPAPTEEVEVDLEDEVDIDDDDAVPFLEEDGDDDFEEEIDGLPEEGEEDDR